MSKKIQNSQEDVSKTLLDAARVIFAKYGYAKTTVDDIARAARKGKSTYYYYYKSKEDIFKDVIEKEAQIFKLGIIESISSPLDPFEKLKNYIITRLQTFRELMNYFSALRSESLDNFEFINDIRNKHYEEQTSIIKMILLEGIKENKLDIDDVDLVAEPIAAILKGLEYNIMFSRDNISFSKERIDKILSLVYYGIANKKS